MREFSSCVLSTSTSSSVIGNQSITTHSYATSCTIFCKAFYIRGIAISRKRACGGCKENLVGKVQHKVLSAALDFSDTIISSLLAAATPIMLRAVELGSVFAVDEALWAYFSGQARSEGKLRFIPNKPHKNGVVAYLMCQRLHFTRLPVCLAFAPAFIEHSPTPLQALEQLKLLLHRSGLHESPQHIIVADSLFSYPSYVLEYLMLRWNVVVSAKSNTRSIPPSLLTLAQQDLPVNHAHTYTDNYVVLQSVAVVEQQNKHPCKHVTSVIASGFSAAKQQQPPTLPSLSYESACALFENETKATVIAT
jgi:hypothetical protein